MRILLTNDDGIKAAGLSALVNALSKEHELVVVAPDKQKSGSAHAITVHDSIEYTELPSDKNIKYYSVGGTPADCVKLAALFLLRDRLPDLVISGINDGSNLGCDTIYSGTVSAALEAAYMGVRGIAVSLYNWGDKDCKSGYTKAAGYIKSNIDKFMTLKLDKHTILNINHPNADGQGIALTKLGYNYYSDKYEVISKDFPNRLQLTGQPLGHSDGDTDVAWARKNYITITPIMLDRNDYSALDYLRRKT